MNGRTLSAPLIHDESNHATGERMRTSLAAQAGFFFRQESPLIIGALVLVAVAVRIALGRFTVYDLVLSGAVFAYWPVQEWVLHRYLLHMKPRVVFGVKVDPQFARAHRIHHRQPWMIETTFLPTRVVVALVPVTVLGWVAATPTLPLAFTGIVMYGAAALLYEWTHYITHSAYAPRTEYVRRIFRNHRLHHFKNEHHWYAFTVPAIDTALGTDPDQESVDKSETVRTLGVED